ncbi:MAG: carboxypeptidase-like regulatory domain-containing protein, partial [Muribaculaceae bacterium]|nr:carboxypeptidase-like regulatory domain-containing protein [Muribaculaceae bacterium]
LSKRIWFSAFGYCDAVLKGGLIWSRVQYPALMWPSANLSFTIQPESYSLMNPMEFPLDHYGALDLSYFANGLLFNQIPLVNRLKLREVVTFKGLMGGLTAKNDPAKDPSLFRFPEDAEVQRLGRKPYMELGVGIDNILTCLRFDYIWRLTYRDLPNATRGGWRVSLHFSF